MIRCREIATADLGAVVDFLTNGFPGHSRNYWMDGLQRQYLEETEQEKI